MTKPAENKLWGGRFSGKTDPQMWALNASIMVDRRLAFHDIRGSQAWVRALHKAGVLTAEEAQTLQEGLKRVADEFAEGQFVFTPSDEDIHTAVERRLRELVGAVAGKLHTGRSRNDQVATDFRLWMLDAINDVSRAIADLQSALLERAEHDFGAYMPGYTHLQQAQPILLSHWWLAHFWALQRDRGRFAQTRERTAVLPLGSAALAGTAYPIDRDALAADLGFKEAAPNSHDAVSDRDFAAEFLFNAALLGVHLSKLAEGVILFSSTEFGFIELSDAYTTGSSLMPQKKNPDAFELARGKSGAFIGNLTGLLATLKGLPSAYDKDLQEDKAPVFRTYDDLMALLPVLANALRTLKVNRERMAQDLDSATLATDLADYLVSRGVPFREAHSIVGKAVRAALDLGVPLAELPDKVRASIHPALAGDLTEAMSVEACLSRRNVVGGTAPEAVKAQLAKAKEALGEA